jgi:hypothetical protein
MSDTIDAEPAEYEGTSKVGLKWRGDNRTVFPEQTFDSAYFRPDFGSLLVNITDFDAVDGYEQYCFDAAKQDEHVAVVEASAVGVPERDSAAEAGLYDLLDDMESVVVVESLDD